MENKYKILKKFYSEDRLRFNELLEGFSSNIVTYYVKKFLSEGLIEKDKDYYYLTKKGEELICHLDKKEGLTSIKQPIHDVFLLPVKGGKYLFTKRLKRPFKGVLIPIGAKIKSGESIFETAEKKLLEDTGFSGKLEYKGIVDVRTFKDGEFFLHHILNVFKATRLKGDFVERTDKGENVWMSEREYFSEDNILSGMKEHLDIVKCKSFMFLELESYMEGEKFVGVKVVRKILF